METIENDIKRRRWTYIGHILRRDGDTKVAMTWAPEGKRKKGRPRETWRRSAERERQEMGWSSWQEVQRKTMDRTDWRKLCYALCSTRSEEDR